MIAKPNTSYSPGGDAARQIRQHLFHLTGNVKKSANPLPVLDRIRQYLEFLPLATGEFDVAVARINNARRYLESGEFGAAGFEIRLLTAALYKRLRLDRYPVTEQVEQDHTQVFEADDSEFDVPMEVAV